jgi:hypothetical protein
VPGAPMRIGADIRVAAPRQQPFHEADFRAAARAGSRDVRATGAARWRSPSSSGATLSSRDMVGTGAPGAGSFNPDRPGSAPASGQRSPLADQDQDRRAGGRSSFQKLDLTTRARGQMLSTARAV